LPTLNTIVASDWVLYLNLRELGVLDSVLRKELSLLFIVENIMLRDQLMLSDVYQKLLLIEDLNLTWLKFFEFLF
jgi:hypothetical protein